MDSQMGVNNSVSKNSTELDRSQIDTFSIKIETLRKNKIFFNRVQNVYEQRFVFKDILPCLKKHW